MSLRKAAGRYRVWAHFVRGRRWPLFVGLWGGLLLAIGLGGTIGVAIGLAGIARETSSQASGFPLRLTKPSLKLLERRISGSVVITDFGRAPAPATKAALVLRPTAGGELTGLQLVSVPGLDVDASHRQNFDASIPQATSTGRYVVLVCLDVDSQIQRFNSSIDCTPTSTISVRQSGPRGTAISLRWTRLVRRGRRSCSRR